MYITNIIYCYYNATYNICNAHTKPCEEVGFFGLHLELGGLGRGQSVSLLKLDHLFIHSLHIDNASGDMAGTMNLGVKGYNHKEKCDVHGRAAIAHCWATV
jgi:hypothetical protein